MDKLPYYIIIGLFGSIINYKYLTTLAIILFVASALAAIVGAIYFIINFKKL